MRKAPVLTFGTLAVIASYAPSFAQDSCAAYSTQAIGQAQENAALNCGFEGAHWSNSINTHIEFCNSASVENMEFHNKLRSFQLEQCQIEKAHPCTAYANAAVQRGKINIEKQCGLTEGRFVASFQDQYDWCYKVEETVVAEVNRTAEAAILQCLGQQ